MKTEFVLQLFDDAQTLKKLGMLNKLEVMFDDARNTLPPDYFHIVENIPMGAKVKVTFEVIEE